MTGDRGHAEDVAQEALARAYRRWDVVGGYDRPGAWTRRVALNLATSARRRRRSERAALARVAGRPAEAVADPAGTDTEIWEVVRTLPRRQATALVLYYLADESIASVADSMGCAEGTAKAHLHQGRAALARRLSDPNPTHHTRTGHDRARRDPTDHRDRRSPPPRRRRPPADRCGPAPTPTPPWHEVTASRPSSRAPWLAAAAAVVVLLLAAGARHRHP